MKRNFAFLPLTFAVGCTTSPTAPGPTISPLAGDGGALTDAAPPPTTASCMGDAAACLHGTLKQGSITAPFAFVTVELYSLFPSGQLPDQSQPVAGDGTWAFSGLVPGSYFVRVLSAAFAGTTPTGTIATVAGPLAVPVVAGQEPAIAVNPVQIELAQIQRGAAGSVQFALAHVFDPQSGAEVLGGLGDGGTDDSGATAAATVSLSVGDANVPMTWSSACGAVGYCAPINGTQPSQEMYQVTTLLPGVDAGQVWTLLAPTGGGNGASIVAPAGDATVAASPGGGDGGAADDASLAVQWAPDLTADYDILELFRASDAGYVAVYASRFPEPPDASGERIPSRLLTPGAYLINLLSSNARCPADKSSGGCVLSSAVAQSQFNAN